MASCSRNNPVVLPEESGALVRWDMVSVAGYTTKSLMENRECLERACTPVDKEYTDGVTGLGQTIGIWADYSITLDGIRQDVTNVFSETELIYNPENSDQVTKWEYRSNPAYWVLGGEYVFRAYYPKNELNVNTKLSNAKTLVIETNTAMIQRDMLLAHNRVDTKSEDFDITAPVAMKFRHAMSALRFGFKFYDGGEGVFYSEDAITSCWLEVDEDNSFAITGFMVYGNGTDYEEGLIQWSNQYYPAKGIRFYYWVYSDGITFKNERPSQGEEWNPSKNQTIATPYSVAGTEADDKGTEYTRQDGWLVTIPQKSNGNLRLCFTTKAGGNVVFYVNIPAKTGTSLDKYNENPDDTEKQKDADGTDWIPGYRYTYTISISKTDATVDLSVAPWKRLDSSFDIKF